MQSFFDNDRWKEYNTENLGFAKLGELIRLNGQLLDTLINLIPEFELLNLPTTQLDLALKALFKSHRQLIRLYLIKERKKLHNDNVLH